MALQSLWNPTCSTKCPSEHTFFPLALPSRCCQSVFSTKNITTVKYTDSRCSTKCRSFSLFSRQGGIFTSKLVVKASKAMELVFGNNKDDGDDTDSSDESDEDDDDRSLLMSPEQRAEFRRKIREVMSRTPDVEEENDPAQRNIKMQKLLKDYPLVVDEEDPDWPEDAEGWGFNFDQFFDKITIKNVKKDDHDDDDDDDEFESGKEVVWQDDNYIQPVRDITKKDWEDFVFKDFNPLVILVHNRYKRPRENEKARDELEKAVKMFWNSGLPSPRCAAVDAVVEDDIADALNVSVFPEILFTKAGKILYREKVVRTADEWSKIMAFFYYKAVRPSFLGENVGKNHEKIPSLN